MDVTEFRAARRLDRIENYVANGRRFRKLSSEALAYAWIEAFKDMTTDPDDIIAPALVNNLTSEFHLRGEVPPHGRAKQLASEYIHAIETALVRAKQEDFEGWVEAQSTRQRDVYVSKLQSSKHNTHVAEPSLREIAEKLSTDSTRAWHLSGRSSPSIVPDEDNSDD